MATEPSAKAKAWVIFDRIVARAAPDNVHSNPWIRSADGQLRFEPDFGTLAQLLPREWPADIADLRADCVERWRRISPCTPQRKIVQGIVLSRYGEPDRT